MEGREAVDDSRVVDLVVLVHLGPRADPDAVGLRDAAVLDECFWRRFPVAPDSFLERASQLGVMRLADEVVALVIEGGVEKEPVVLELEVLAVLSDAALSKSDELLSLGQRSNRHSPLFET